MNDDLEERLRRALEQRAGQITADRLRPALPPTAMTTGPAWVVQWRRLLPAAAVAVAVVTAVLVVSPLVRRPERPLPPAFEPSTPVPSSSQPLFGSNGVTAPPSVSGGVTGSTAPSAIPEVTDPSAIPGLTDPSVAPGLTAPSGTAPTPDGRTSLPS